MSTTTNITHQTAPTPPVQPQSLRKLHSIYRAPGLHWVGDGFRVSGYFSAIPDVVRRMDPFLLLDYHPPYDYAPTERPRGVGVHPHRGFETVTLAWQGSVAHHDSAGGGGVIGPGDVQWMTAASGILHKEYHEESYARRGGPFQMAQLWVNLPRAKKQMAPEYQGVQGETMPVDERDGQRIHTIVGASSPAALHTEVEYLDVTLLADGSFDRVIGAGQSTLLYVLDGAVTVGAREVPRGHALVLGEGELRARGRAGTRVAWLRGKPHGEPIRHRGPFVD